MKYVRASAGRAGISIVFEDVNQPRHDGKTIYLPRITDKTTDLELKQLMASVDHEVAHDKFSDFEVLRSKKVPAKSLLMFMWNFLEDSRINMIEANEYAGFRENWDKCTAILTKSILDKASKEKSGLPALVTALMHWDGEVCAYNFPRIHLITNRVKPSEKILDVLNNYSSRLVHCHSIIDKTIGITATYELAEDILKELSEVCPEELPEPKPEPASGEGKGEGKSEDDGSTDQQGDGESSEDGKAVKEDEYNVYEITVTEDDLAKFSLSMSEAQGMGKVGINFKPVASTRGSWTMADLNDFVVVDL